MIPVLEKCGAIPKVGSGVDNITVTPHMAGKLQHSPDSLWMGLCRGLVTMSQLQWPGSFVDKEVKPRCKWLEEGAYSNRLEPREPGARGSIRASLYCRNSQTNGE